MTNPEKKIIVPDVTRFKDEALTDAQTKVVQEFRDSMKGPDLEEYPAYVELLKTAGFTQNQIDQVDLEQASFWRRFAVQMADASKQGNGFNITNIDLDDYNPSWREALSRGRGDGDDEDDIPLRTGHRR